MIKDRTRDYAVAAFRDYATSVDLLDNGRSPAQLADTRAVRDMLARLHDEGQSDILAAVQAIYFDSPSKLLRKGEIDKRVTRFATEYPADKATVYRWLRRARTVFAQVRGLSVD